MTEELERKVQSLENDLQLRTAQINDLQAKIVDNDEGSWHFLIFGKVDITYHSREDLVLWYMFVGISCSMLATSYCILLDIFVFILQLF